MAATAQATKNNHFYRTLVVPSISPAGARADGTVNGVAVDCSLGGGVDEVVCVVMTGTVTDGTNTFSVEQSPDGSTAWEAVHATQISGTAPVLTTAAADDDSVQEWGITVDPAKPFLRIVSVTTGATTGGIFGACVVLPDCDWSPVTHV